MDTMRFLLLTFLLSLNLFCKSPQKEPVTGTSGGQVTAASDTLVPDNPSSAAEDLTNAEVAHYVIRTDDNSYGYMIFVNGLMYIEQKTIPAIQGNKGFASKEDAEKIARLVVTKIKQGESLPTISVEELTQNGIKF